MTEEIQNYAQNRSQLVENHLQLCANIEDHEKSLEKLRSKQSMVLDEIKLITSELNRLVESEKAKESAE